MPMQQQYASGYGNRKSQESATTKKWNSISPGSCMQASPSSLEESCIQLRSANMLRLYNSGLTLTHQGLLNGRGEKELENDVACTSRKRSSEPETSLARQRTFFRNVNLRQQQGNNSPASHICHAAPAVSNGLSSEAYVKCLEKFAGSKRRIASYPSVFQRQLQCEILKQKQEIDQIVKAQGEQMKQALEEKTLRRATFVLAAVEESVLKMLKDKEVELEKVKQRNLELEERVKKLRLESGLWQNMSRSNEMMVLNLRTTLEQVVAQSIERIAKEGCGESEGENSGLFQHDYGEASDVCEIGMEGLDQCRVCSWRKEVYILLLPCRHLCSLCKDCEARLNSCPVCKATKNATLQVYMS